MTVKMTGRMLAHAAWWANGAPVTLCAEIMSVSVNTARKARQRVQQKYAAAGVTIRNSSDMAQALAAELPSIKPQRRPTAYLPEPSRHRRRPSTITPGRLVIVQQLRSEGLSVDRIADQLGVGRNAVSRAFARAERRAIFDAEEQEDTTKFGGADNLSKRADDPA